VGGDDLLAPSFEIRCDGHAATLPPAGAIFPATPGSGGGASGGWRMKLNRRRRLALSWLGAAMVVAGMGMSPAHAAVFVSPAPNLPGTVAVGQGFTGRINVLNNSTPPSTGAMTVSAIVFVPACAVLVADCAGGVDPGVFQLSATGSGSQACAGTAFGISQGQPGVFQFTSAAVVLNVGQVCTIDFAMTTLKLPAFDTSASAGTQTNAVATASGTVAGLTSRGSGAQIITVTRPQPTISTSATPAVAQVGNSARDTAVLTGASNPTGTVTFRLYSDASCTVQVFASTNPYVQPTGATSDDFTVNVPGTYHWVATFNGDAANAATGPTSCTDPAETLTIVPGGHYHPLSPTRIEDTRVGDGNLTGPVGAGATVDVQVGGRGGVPVGASTAVLNVTATSPSTDGFLTLYPTGSGRPLASNINFTPGATVPNLVVVKLGPNGKVSMFNSAGTTHVIYDVAGYFDDVGGNAGRYQPLVPARIADTRLGFGGVALLPGQSIDVAVAGQGGSPASGVQAAVLNVTATDTTAVSFLTVYPTGEARPLASNLNWAPGDTVANRVMTKLGTGGKVTVYNGSGTADLIVDLGGTYTDATVAGPLGTYLPTTPVRILDTRTGIGDVVGPVAGGATVEVQVTGRGGVPETGVRAVALNLTETQPAGAGYLTVFPRGVTRPNASDLNVAPSVTRANLVVVQLGTGGRVSVFTSTQAHVIFDVAGFFT
jgi:hypothetical protein